MRSVLNELNTQPPQASLMFQGKTYPILSLIAQGTVTRQRLSTIVTRISEHRSLTAATIQSHFQVLLTILSENTSDVVTGQALPLTDLLNIFHAYGQRHLTPPRGEFIQMAVPVMTLFESLQNVQLISDQFYRSLAEWKRGTRTVSTPCDREASREKRPHS